MGGFERSRVVDKITVEEIFHAQLFGPAKKPFNLTDNLFAEVGRNFSGFGKFFKSHQYLISRHELIRPVPKDGVIAFPAPE